MRRTYPNIGQVVFAVALAVVFWHLTFNVKWMNFWLSMGTAVISLTILSFCWGRLANIKKKLTIPGILLGTGSSFMLYGIFWIGNLFAQSIFQFAKPEISSIYDIRQQGQTLLITIVLLFVTSPGEEIFWRGFLQDWAMQKFGPTVGWLLAATIYGGVHLLSANIMLTLAALVAGLFWGYLYLRFENISICIISHALWTVAIFVFRPIL